MPETPPEFGDHEQQPDKPEVTPEDLSFLSSNAPSHAPTIDTGATPDSSLTHRVRRGTGNELVYTALISAIFAHFMPFGFILYFLSLFLLARVVLSESSPSPLCIALGVAVCLWSLVRLGLWLFILLPAIF